MEIAIFISDINKIYQCEDSYNPHNIVIKERYGELYKKIGQLVDFKIPDRLYFGSEFCQKLMPSLDECKIAYAYAIDHGMKFTFVTSGLFENGIKKAEKSISYLNGLDDEVEVVCNDWGTVHLIRSKYKRIKIVLGRMIDKLPREPRIPKQYFNNIYGREGLDFLRTPNFFVNEYKEILMDYGIKMVELDCVPQGLNLCDARKNNWGIALYMPFYYVTTGVICMAQIMSADEDDKFNFTKQCSQICKNIDMIMRKQDDFIGEQGLELIRKGNTVYKNIDNVYDYVKKQGCVDRIILQHL